MCVIHGFEDKITALQFEWAWQNVDKSKAFREALAGDEKLAKKMKRSLGPKARLQELRILLKECLPFCLYSLTVYFPERYYHDIFSGILSRGKNGNPYKKDDDESDAFEPLMNIEVCSVENMPVAREAAKLKEKKKARQEAKKIQKKQKEKTPNYESDFSDWLESVKSVVDDDSCWSDLLYDDNHDDDDSSRSESSPADRRRRQKHRAKQHERKRKHHDGNNRRRDLKDGDMNDGDDKDRKRKRRDHDHHRRRHDKE